MTGEELLLQLATGLLFHQDADIIEPVKDVKVSKERMRITLQNGCVFVLAITAVECP